MNTQIDLYKTILYHLTFFEYEDLKICYEFKKQFDKYIEKNLTKKKLIGNIIYKELIERVFNPKRLLYISNTYNINIEELFNLY